MNVFVLSTGRTGTLSLERACRHIENYTCSHESKCSQLGAGRLSFPENHIEIDNRLSSVLGRLDEKYGDDAIYIHMLRSPEQVAESYLKRWNRETSIIRAYAYGILKLQEHHITEPLEISKDYVHTVNSNISHFLSNKSRKMIFQLDDYEKDFTLFWGLIGAKGNFEKALTEFNKTYNTSETSAARQNAVVEKLLRIAKKLPSFIKNA